MSGLPGGGKRGQESQSVHLKAVKVAEFQSRFDVNRSKVVEIDCKGDLLARCQLRVQSIKMDGEFFEKIMDENTVSVLKEVQSIKMKGGDTDNNINSLAVKALSEAQEIDAVMERLSFLRETMLSA